MEKLTNTFTMKAITRYLLFFITIITVIFNSGYVLMMTGKYNPIYLLVAITILLILICFTKIKNVSIIMNYYYMSFIMLLIFMIITYVINVEFDSTFLYVNMFAVLIMSFCISWLIEMSTFINIYIKCLKYITIISLFFYFIENFLNIRLNFPIISTANASYKNGIVFFQLIGLENRNTGIFWEPGLFASFLIVGMVFEISFKKLKASYSNLFIFFIGLLTTNSTAGYMLIPLVFALFISENFKGYHRVLLWISITFVGITFYLFYDQLILYLVKSNPDLFLKLINNSSNSTTRTNGPLLNIDIFKQKPFFGVGFSKATEDFIKRAASWNADSQTSTSTFYLAAMGMPGLIYSLNWIKGTLSLKNKNLLSKITIFIIFLIIINKEPHTGLVVTNCLMFFLIKDKKSSTSY